MATIAAIAVGAAGVGTQAYGQSQQKGKTTTTPRLPPASPQESRVAGSTNQLLEEARAVVENAVGQGQDITPYLYNLLGITPTVQDNTAAVQQASAAETQAQQQFTDAQQTQAQLRAIPAHKRTRAQRQQLRQLAAHIPELHNALQSAQAALGRVETTAKQITGLQPGTAPAASPWSPQNPLNQAVTAEQQALLRALNGQEPVDPTLQRQWTNAEGSLRARLAAQYGPDYENSSVGQIALQNFTAMKANAFTTWNQQFIQNYQGLAFGGAQNLNQLLAQQMGLLLAPSQNAQAAGQALDTAANAQTNQENYYLNQRLAGTSQTVKSVQGNPVAGAGGAAAALGSGGSLASLLYGNGSVPTTSSASTPNATTASTNVIPGPGGTSLDLGAGGGGAPLMSGAF